MHNTSVFFEEYKRLDHLCGDLFGSRAGVTACLSQRERDTFEGRRIPNRDADYQMLKRFRHLRARLRAHRQIGFPNPLRCKELRRPPFPVAPSLKRRIKKPTVSLSSIPSFLLFSFLF